MSYELTPEPRMPVEHWQDSIGNVEYVQWVDADQWETFELLSLYPLNRGFNCTSEVGFPRFARQRRQRFDSWVREIVESVLEVNDVHIYGCNDGLGCICGVKKP
jgi:hypothetical protein